jgi:hypothetical protein
MSCICRFSNGIKCSNPAYYPFNNPKVCSISSHKEKLMSKLKLTGGSDESPFEKWAREKGIFADRRHPVSSDESKNGYNEDVSRDE